jgi:hypothetical protein
MKTIIGRSLASLAVGVLFGLAMSTSIPDPHAVASGAAASAFMYGGFLYNARVERREAAALDQAEDREPDT